MSSVQRLYQDQQFQLLYFQTADLWQKLCEMHAELLDLTFDEYALLLENDIEGLEAKIKAKEELVERITKIDAVRKDVIEQVNVMVVDHELGPINKISDLLDIMGGIEVERTKKHLFRFNALLIDMIEKIQEQNKKNQIVINKAVHSLQQIREDAMGEKHYKTYNSRGATTKSVSPV